MKEPTTGKASVKQPGMEKTITKLASTLPLAPTLKRVAAYARVSSETDRLMHSLSAQISQYASLVRHFRLIADPPDFIRRPLFNRLILSRGGIDIQQFPEGFQAVLFIESGHKHSLHIPPSS